MLRRLFHIEESPAALLTYPPKERDVISNYLTIYLIPWFRGSRYGYEHPDMKDIPLVVCDELGKVSFTLFCEWFINEAWLDYPVPVTDMRYWVHINEDCFMDLERVRYLLPYLKQEDEEYLEWDPEWDEQKHTDDLTDDLREIVIIHADDRSLVLRQLRSVMHNYSRIVF